MRTVMECLDIEFYGGPCDGADARVMAGVKRLLIPVSGYSAKCSAEYVRTDRRTAVGRVFEFRGYVSWPGNKPGEAAS